jgi:hypothetical protein
MVGKVFQVFRRQPCHHIVLEETNWYGTRLMWLSLQIPWHLVARDGQGRPPGKPSKLGPDHECHLAGPILVCIVFVILAWLGIVVVSQVIFFGVWFFACVLFI